MCESRWRQTGRGVSGLGRGRTGKAQISFVCSQHSMALCHSKQPLSFKCTAPSESFETLGGKEREREEIEGWAGSSEFHCAILGCDVICRYQAHKQSSIF